MQSRSRSKSIASEKLKERVDLVEIIPIEYINSAKTKIEGSYTVHDPGNYILVFDNTFSKNTPKIVTFSVALVDPNMEGALEHPKAEISGWLLKKRRKKLQGWAKRWFELSKSGVLSYSASPTSLTRGSVQILLSTISLSPQQRTIHIDSGSSLFHLRCQTNEDYEKWTTALKSYKKEELEYHDSSAYGNNSQKQEKEKEEEGQQENQYPTVLDMNLSRSSIHADYHSADTLWSYIDTGIRNAELLSSNIAIIKRNTDLLMKEMQPDPKYYTLVSEHEKIATLANDQIIYWKEIQSIIQHLLNTDPTLSTLSMSRSHSKVKIPEDTNVNRPQDSLLRTNSSASCSSIQNSCISDQFYDAESVIISSDDDDYNDPHHAIFSGDSSTLSTTTDEEEKDSILNNNNILEESHFIDMISRPSNFHRRQTLPSPTVRDEASILSIFRKNIGKDLSQIAMPVSMNEPLSMLQKACEDLEYSELLDKAAKCENSMDRLMYVAAFAISSYACAQWRTGRKPFNPIMSETYECVRPDKGFRFISEKVSHHPLIIASHAESRQYKYWQCSKVKSKFWGKSLEFISEGTYHVELPGSNEHYTYVKPSSWMRNMIAGEKYLEHVGEMKVMNQTTGEYGVIVFKEGTGGGLFSAPKERNNVVGLFYTSEGKKVKKMVGKWSDQLAEDVNMDGRTLSVIWKATYPTNLDHCKKYYGFSQFAIELNEITPIEKDKLPKTDSRYRPDQRLYEEGKVQEAEREKLRIEKKQRETRAIFAEKGIPWNPRWFKLVEDPYEKPSFYSMDNLDEANAEVGHTWKFTGEYWNFKEKNEWPSDTLDLW
ncbi:Oxysterol-binding protein-domain-containing protein [Cokeromyces recurvatus]|uniref:Oxysterol-binding protein-domain-containing protein n=1 Tax=Cokeromyces recurvatus TaxID=90255 RepID=UPI002220E7BA|nr:Oxysterol-binding protein-domain-containing protein [Cokeromyces recurvatus]KAI7905217.1 Oxysterol-binding protein-domain-containing protein [Cokeromyces recurvatus]